MTQAQPNLLELAKQGNAKALAQRGAIAHIATLMNESLVETQGHHSQSYAHA
jgi:hypothetical protein